VVKCADCGFLTHRNFDRSAFVEADEQYRVTGKPIISLPSDEAALPICLMRIVDFREEIERQAIERGEGVQQAVHLRMHPNDGLYAPLFNEERNQCEGFTPYLRGFGPQAHREMMDRERELKREHERHTADIAAQAEIARIAKETAGIQAGSVRLAFWALVVTSAISIAGIGASILLRDTRPNVINYYSPLVTPTGR
jgi:hypothetical protein